jgi:hypothetical protein
MARGPECHAVLGEGGVRPLHVVGCHQPRDVDEPSQRCRLTGQRMRVRGAHTLNSNRRLRAQRRDHFTNLFAS